MFKITFLGTGTSQGIPIIGSKHPVCLSQKSEGQETSGFYCYFLGMILLYVIDCGPDFRQQLLRNPIPRT